MPGFKAVTRPTILASGGMTVSLLAGSSAGRGFVDRVDISVEGTPADNAINFKIDRFSAVGGASAVTNIGYDEAADAGNNRITVKQNSTVEPTYSSAPLWQGTINQRVTYTVQPPRPWAISTASGGGIGLFANATASGQVLDVVWSWTE